MKRAIIAVGLTLIVAGCGTKPAWETLPLGTSADFRSIYFADADHGWIAGGGYNIPGGLLGRTSDGGKTWHFTSELVPNTKMGVTALHFFDAEHGVAATDHGRMLSTSDAGESWTFVEQQVRADMLTSVFFLDARRGWAAGHGHIGHTEDGGQTWTRVTDENIDRAYESPIRAMQFLDDRRGWIAGMQASLKRTDDGGVTWEGVPKPVAANEHPDFWDLFFVDSQTGWIVGEEGNILATTDGGATWSRQNTGVKDAHSAPKLERIPQANGVAVIDAGDRTPGLTLASVRFLDRKNGWVVGFYPNYARSLILRTKDGGEKWTVEQEILDEELRTLFVQGRERLWAIGARTRPGTQSIYRRFVDGK